VRSNANRSSSNKNKQKPPAKRNFPPKLLVDEDVEKSRVLIKITRNSGVRQIINYSLPKLKADWVVEFNAFNMDIGKILEAVEIIKTRNPFLHQMTKIISWTKPAEEGQKARSSTGLSVTLSRILFEVSDKAGYQKPKPRQFVQPHPRKKLEEKVAEPSAKEESNKGTLVKESSSSQSEYKLKQ
jgi:hypothetical protein